MSIAEALLVFAGIPLAIVAVVFALVYGISGRRSTKRYRPGRPMQFSPVWFVAANGRGPDAVAKRALAAGAAKTALPPGTESAGTASDGPAATQHGETGGASDSW